MGKAYQKRHQKGPQKLGHHHSNPCLQELAKETKEIQRRGRIITFLGTLVDSREWFIFLQDTCCPDC